MNQDIAKAFTLIELLITISIIAIVASVVFIAVNPAQRLLDSRNARRHLDAEAIVDAINLYQIDHPSDPITEIDGSWRMLGSDATGCSTACIQTVAQTASKLPWYFIKPARADGIGWVLPTSAVDIANQWSDEALGYDNNVATYASNQFGSAGWGQFIEYDLTNPIISDRIRLLVDYMDAHITEIDVDVYKDGAWVDVFQGGNEATWNVKWVELIFAKGSVSKARFRYNYRVGGYHYWLYELQFYQSALTIVAPQCQALVANAINANSAILKAVLTDDGGEPVSYRFIYGLSTNFGQATAWQDGLIRGSEFQTAVTGLSGVTSYYYQAQVRNSVALVDCPVGSFTTGEMTTGWLLPYNNVGSGTNWQNVQTAYDDSLDSGAVFYHQINTPPLSDWLYFQVPPVSSDRLRFFAKSGLEINQIDIEVYKDGLWSSVYSGPVANRQWVEKTFVSGQLSQARVRFATPYPNRGFSWELYEFNIWQSGTTGATFVSNGNCLNLSNYLVPRYLVAMPFDKKFGNPGKTNYLVKKENNSRKITVKSCQWETEEIRVTK